MEIVMWVFVGIGGILSIVGNLWLLVTAFEESDWWGIACLIIPLSLLVFVPLHWQRTNTPFLVMLVGSLIFFGTMAMFGNF